MAPGVFTCAISAGASNRNVIPNDVFRITKNKLVSANLTVGRLDLPHLKAMGGKKLKSLVIQDED
jgi:hypothetical protein